MKLVRFQARDRIAYGILNSDEVIELDGGPFSLKERSTRHPLYGVRLLAPCEPSKIVAVGLNYSDHARELDMQVPDNPILFLKPPTTVIGPGEPIVSPAMSSQVDHEGELAIVIRDRIHCISPGEARQHILGYTCANDVTARDLQKKDGQWTRAKSFDTFCPVGPWIETAVNPDDLLIETLVNGHLRQSSRTSQFIFGVDLLVSFISQVMTLVPGDLIITGTPAGIGPMKPGDTVEVRIQGIGSLKNSVISDSELRIAE